MSIITLPNIYSNGEVIDAGQLNANFSTIVNDYNGGINNSNLSPSIAITDNHLNQITSASKVSGTALTGLASIPSGAGVIPAANLIYSNIQFPYVKVSETQSSGTNSQTSISINTWVNIVLNTTDNDTASISSLSGNELTLPSGTYTFTARVPIYETVDTQIRLFNNTASTVLTIGSSEVAASAGNYTTNSYISGLFTLGSSSAISIQINASGSGLTGLAASRGTEVYVIATFNKIQ